MQTGDNLEYFKKNHVSSKIFKDFLEKNNWIPQTYGKDAGPSLNFIHSEYKGKFGLIAPYSKDFCQTCNRLRITSRGDLRLCLFGNTGISIRHLLQDDTQKDELVQLENTVSNLKKELAQLNSDNEQDQNKNIVLSETINVEEKVVNVKPVQERANDIYEDEDQVLSSYMPAQERSDALLDLVYRMELKAAGY